MIPQAIFVVTAVLTLKSDAEPVKIRVNKPRGTVYWGGAGLDGAYLQDSRRGRWYAGEAHRRVALGTATLPFGLLAMGLALGRRNLSRSTGTLMGIAGAIAYYALMQLAEGLLRGDSTPVALAIWLPNFVMTSVAAILILMAGRNVSASDRSSGQGSRTLLERFGVVHKGIRVKRFALPRYVAGQFLGMAAVCVAGLVIAYLI